MLPGNMLPWWKRGFSEYAGSSVMHGCYNVHVPLALTVTHSCLNDDCSYDDGDDNYVQGAA